MLLQVSPRYGKEKTIPKLCPQGETILSGQKHSRKSEKCGLQKIFEDIKLIWLNYKFHRGKSKNEILRTYGIKYSIRFFRNFNLLATWTTTGATER